MGKMALARSGRTAAGVLAWGVLPVLLAHWFAAGPGVLGILRGPLGLVLMALAAGIALARLWRPAWPRPLPGVALFLLALAAYLPAGLHYANRLQVSGDEPYYLLMAQSLWRDHDLDLENNFAREDWREYTPGPLSTHYGSPRRDGRPYPTHSPGLSALLAPAYASGGRAACVIVLAALAALLGLETRRLAWRITADPGASFFAWAAAAGPPVFFYAFHVYSELPSALCVVLSLNLLLGAPGAAGAALAALLASFLPWLHVKMVPAAAALGMVALLRLRGRALLAFVGVAGAVAMGYMAYYQAIFGHPTPLAIYGGIVPPDARSSPLSAVAGLLLDRSFGLLPHAPIFLIALLGLGPLVTRARRDTWPHLLVGLAVLAPVLVWRMWWGGQCPPGRFLVPLVPILAVALALRVAEPARGLARWRVALLTLGLGLAAFMVAEPGRLLLLNRGNRPTRVWSALSGDTPVERYLPSLALPDPAEARVALLWLAGFLAVLALDHLAKRHDRIDGWFRGLALPVLALWAIGLGVDAWARAGVPRGNPPPEEASSVAQSELPAVLLAHRVGIARGERQLEHFLDR